MLVFHRGFLAKSSHIHEEVGVGDHGLQADVVVPLHLLVDVEVGGGAVTFIKTLTRHMTP